MTPKQTVTEAHQKVQQILEQLSFDLPDIKFCHFFEACLRNEDGTLNFIGNGFENSDDHDMLMYQVLIFCLDNSTDEMRKMFYLAVVNHLSEENPELGFKLGAYTERKYGPVKCNCEQCRAHNN